MIFCLILPSYIPKKVLTCVNTMFILINIIKNGVFNFFLRVFFMFGEKAVIKGIVGGFDDFSVVDWIMLAIGVLKLLSEIFESDGNGGIKPKE